MKQYIVCLFSGALYYIYKLPYFIKFSAYFFTLKMMLKYSLYTIHGMQSRKGLRWLLWWLILQWLILVKLFLKNKIFFFAKNHCEIQVHAILVRALYTIKYGNKMCCSVDKRFKSNILNHFLDITTLKWN